MSKISNKIYSIYKNKLYQLIFVVIVIELVFLPMPGSAIYNTENSENIEKKANNKVITKVTELIEPVFLSNNNDKQELIAIEEQKENGREIAWTKRYAMTAYNSEVAQCDDSPCITANGFNVCEHGIEDTVAANFLPFGTEIRIPELFGDRIFVVRDRMNKRYTERVDVWFLSKDNAIDFGVKYPTIEILK